MAETAAGLPAPQVCVLDAGGQYCHLIARRVRELGVYAEVRPSEISAPELAACRGIIISGGPASVYAPESPKVDRRLFELGVPALGICYGQQLMAYMLDGAVRKGSRGEYGLAMLEVARPGGLFNGLSPREQVWMSHRDQVETPPPGFEVLGSTETCAIAAMADVWRRLYAVQFHPEVVHTPRGMRILENFVFAICGCQRDWDPKRRIPIVERLIREVVGERNVFFFVSGGVDSTVAATLCLRALGPERVRGVYVDTGLMREGETDFVRRVFGALGASGFWVEDAGAAFLGALGAARDPEQKRHIIGEQFVAVQERILESGHFLDRDWILGQGTIYPDTIESGGTEKADVIKTHHNRVPGIQRLIEENRIVEPLTSFYKDEVREIGRELGLPDELIHRHPFPGPGLAIRCLCAAQAAELRRCAGGWLLPVRSVGVQGDERSYRPVLALDGPFSNDAAVFDRATALVNQLPEVNRVVACLSPLDSLAVQPSSLTPERLSRLRRADAIVRRLSHQAGYDAAIWQFPVVLIPLGAPGRPDSVVLRPVHSVDGMTAQAVPMPPDLLAAMRAELLALEGVAAVLYDLTHKPPATIEWE